MRGIDDDKKYWGEKRMKCNDAMIFLSQVSAKSITAPISDENLNFLISNGYVDRISKDEYEKLLASVSSLSKATGEREEAHAKELTDEESLARDQKKVHSIRFWFEDHEKKESDRERVQTDEQLVEKDEEILHEKDDEVQSLILKKSTLDRQVPCNGCYLSLTETGVVMLYDLTIRNYRVGNNDFKDFIQETKATVMELQSIAERANHYYSEIKAAIPSIYPISREEEEEYRIKSRGIESSQLWAISIGLAKLEGDPDKIKENFLQILGILKSNNSNLDSKLMAAETLVASGYTVNTPQIHDTLSNIDSQIRKAKAPEELSAGISATIFCGQSPVPDGLTRFNDFAKITKSYAAASILSISKESEDELRQNFDFFKSTFDEWGYSPSEDTDLASAYLAVSVPKTSRENLKDKMKVIIDALKDEFGFPLVPAAILTSIQSLNANELLDLVEKGVTILKSQPLTAGLEHSELASLSIRMIYGQ
jgi:hypothetical protein